MVFYKELLYMQLKNSYYFFKSAISPETCDRIIDLGLTKMQEEESKGHSTEAYTFGNKEKKSMPDSPPQGDLTVQDMEGQGVDKFYVRDSNVSWLDQQWLYDLLTPFVEQANILAGWNWSWDYSENFQFTVYKPGQFYGWHRDGDSDHLGKYRRYLYGITPEPLTPDGKLPSGYVTDPKMVGKVRKLSMTINLNKPGEYEGGNLKFDFGPHAFGNRFHECEEIRPQGSIVVFPSFIDHCVTPVTQGTRYSLVLWALGEPWK